MVVKLVTLADWSGARGKGSPRGKAFSRVRRWPRLWAGETKGVMPDLPGIWSPRGPPAPTPWSVQPAASLPSESWQVVVQGLIELKWIHLDRAAASLLPLHDFQEAAIDREEFFEGLALVEGDAD